LFNLNLAKSGGGIKRTRQVRNKTVTPRQRGGKKSKSSETSSTIKSTKSKSKKTKGRVKIDMEYIENKIRRYTTFSKRKTGIMKKAYELSTLTGTQVMLLVASETGHIYTFATEKLRPIINSQVGKDLIKQCLNYNEEEEINLNGSNNNNNNNNTNNNNINNNQVQSSIEATTSSKVEVLEPGQLMQMSTNSEVDQIIGKKKSTNEFITTNTSTKVNFRTIFLFKINNSR
jgi:hypothetical protein